MTPRGAGLAGLVLLCVGGACRDAEPPAPSAVGDEPPLLVDRAAAWGLEFEHDPGATGELYYPEMMGGGAAWVDYDGDGDLDAFLVQGGRLGPGAAAPGPPGDRLFRNDLPAAAAPHEPRFVDVGAAALAGLPGGHGMGIAAGDYDGDGATDLYITRFGDNVLLRNRGDGLFEDRTDFAGVGDGRWSVPALFWDADADGRLDLWAGNYLDFTIATHKVCRDPAGEPDYCGPTAYRGVTDRLWRNLGQGRFEDRSLASGVGAVAGRTLGGVAADLDGDGFDELYVANDGEPNFLWSPRGGGAFEDRAAWAGCAVNGDGRPEAGMGVDAADFDGDGDLDLFLTHLTGESNTLYRNDGGAFTDVSRAAGLALASWPLTGFGARGLDLESDGDLDLLIANGAVHRQREQAVAGDPYPLRQPRQLYRNLGGGRFEEISAAAGEAFRRPEVGRGAAFGDVDGDGDGDVLVVNSGGPARLLVQSGTPAAWIGASVLAGRAGADLLGARVRFEAGGAVLLRRVAADGSYASASDPRALAGLGAAAGPVRLTVEAPGRRPRQIRDLPAGFYYRVPMDRPQAARR